MRIFVTSHIKPLKTMSFINFLDVFKDVSPGDFMVYISGRDPGFQVRGRT